MLKQMLFIILTLFSSLCAAIEIRLGRRHEADRLQIERLLCKAVINDPTLLDRAQPLNSQDQLKSFLESCELFSHSRAHGTLIALEDGEIRAVLFFSSFGSMVLKEGHTVRSTVIFWPIIEHPQKDAHLADALLKAMLQHIKSESSNYIELKYKFD